jgi:transcriptional regulator with XRE-family HTH domain
VFERRSGGRRLVEEAEDAADATVVFGHRNVEPDGERLTAGSGYELPCESNDVVMRVDPAVVAVQPEHVPWNLLVKGCDEIEHPMPALDVCHRVDVTAVERPDLRNRVPACIGIGLVPHVEISLDQLCCVHSLLLSDWLASRSMRPAAAPVDYLTGNRDVAHAVYDRQVNVIATRPPVGALLRDWRHRRRLSQFELALHTGVSSRHLSFVETGRARPSAEMVLQLAEQLDVPLRDRNQLLLAAGYAPAFAQRELDAPEMGPVRDAIDQVLRGHEPYPALVVDRHWGLVAANRALGVLVVGVSQDLLEPPINVLRLSLHPDGLAPRILNLQAWRTHLLERLARDALVTGDPALSVLHDELAGYPVLDDGDRVDPAFGDIAVPLRIRQGGRQLSFLSTKTTFGTAVDVTVAELSIESFFPADRETARAMHALLEASGSDGA